MSIVTLFQNSSVAGGPTFLSTGSSSLKKDATSPFLHLNNRESLSTYEKGISAELCAEKELRTKGYEIIARRLRTKYGEIDILAKKENNVVAVEVKQRKSLDAAKSCISRKQQQRIANALMSVITDRNDLFENYRIDVICLDSVGRFEHIEDAFRLEGSIAC